jgi:DNA polymerase III subunit beta
MQLLEKNLHDPDEQVRVTVRPNEILFQTDQATIYSRLVEGRYPKYQEVFPKKVGVKVPLVVGPFHAAIRQAAVMAENDTKKVVCGFEAKKLVLRAQSAEAGRSQVVVPIDYTGKALEIGFDPKLLTDMLRALDPMDELTLEMTDGKTPALFRAGDDYSYLVMPLY